MAITIFDPDQRRRENQAAFLQALQTFGQLAQIPGALEKSRAESALARQQSSLFNSVLPTLQGAVGTQAPTVPPLQPRLSPPQSPIGLTGFSVGPSGPSFSFGQTPESKQQIELQTESKKASERISQGLQTFKVLKTQFDKALPDNLKKGDLPIFQRLEGAIQKIGAKAGLVDNPQLVALSKMEVPATRLVLKAMGEGARMSDQDIEQMLGSLNLGGMTSKERAATVKLFFDIASTQMDEETKNTFLNDPVIKDMFGSLSEKQAGTKNQLTVKNLFEGLE